MRTADGRARRLGAAAALILFSLLLVLPIPAALAGGRRAGTVLAVDPQSRVLVLDEFGANAERRALRVQVPPQAVVLLSQRNKDGRDLTDSFRESTITLSDIRPGDFVVVELSSDPDVARLVMVTLRGRAGS
ncbi:MAG TPA: hypothetical protein VNL97_01005 [Solirubrobacterales bacterium]|nr:hypothetical protein [Methylomirabilota bacterium]HWP32304.1 hypothetical protein [Solirubrobacterales bacterium]